MASQTGEGAEGFYLGSTLPSPLGAGPKMSQLPRASFSQDWGTAGRGRSRTGGHHLRVVEEIRDLRPPCGLGRQPRRGEGACRGPLEVLQAPGAVAVEVRREHHATLGVEVEVGPGDALGDPIGERGVVAHHALAMTSPGSEP